MYYKLANVIGSDDKVRVGTKDEYKYFSVIDATRDGTEKVFYASPQLWPGYYKLSCIPESTVMLSDIYDRIRKYDEPGEDYVIVPIVTSNE